MTPIAPEWHNYRLEERHAPWKLLLPISKTSPILAINLRGSELASLARSWGVVHFYGSPLSEIEWANKQSLSLGHNYSFVEVDNPNSLRFGYPAIAINIDVRLHITQEKIFRMLEPGGTAVWIGKRNQIPSAAELAREGYKDIRRFSFLPPSSRKIMLPLNDGRMTKQCLKMICPINLKNKLAVKMGHVAISIGAHDFLSANQVITGFKQGRLLDGEYFIDWINDHVQQPAAWMSIYAGWSKLVCQLFDNQFHVTGFAKFADTAAGRKGIERESSVIRMLSILPAMKDSMPKIQLLREWQGHTIQIQTTEGLTSRKCTKKLTLAHLDFLQKLSSIDRCEMFLEQWPTWTKIREWVDESASFSPTNMHKLREELKRTERALASVKIPFHRVHGDFAPWHALDGRNGIVVVDWEQSESSGLPFFDAANYLLSQTTNLKEKPFDIEFLNPCLAIALSKRSALNSLCRNLNVSQDIARLAVLYCYIMSKSPVLRDHIWDN
jgi:hypothetical protein